MPETAPRTHVEIFDTSLRDGAQREGISYSLEDKLRIARKLDELGVAFIEGGWPGSNPKDAAFFERVRQEGITTARIVAFGATRRAKLRAADDPSVRALVDAGTAVCTVFGKTSPLQVTEVLRTTLEENLAMIEDTVAYLRGQGRRVIYDAEHFFDGHDADPAYALECLRAAARGGAETLTLCDTNGGHLPWQVEDAVRAVRAQFPAQLRIGIHAHDDTGCGVANSVAAVRGGATHVQGTINGYGERCGNANLCVIIPNLELKLGCRALPEGRLVHLHEVARFVAEVANLAPDEHMAYLGNSAFAHKGGVHVSAMLRHPAAYQHIDPALVGNQMRVVVSELAGRANLVSKATELGLTGLDDQTGARVVEIVKARENEGFSFEAAEASVVLIARRLAPGYQPLFTLVDYRGMVSRHGDRTLADATIKLRIGEHEVHTAAEGNGPVNAFDRALRKALLPLFPQVNDIQLADYKVRILNSNSGTGAVTRVLIDWHDGLRRWSTVGAGTNILDATWLALADGYEYILTPAGQPAPANA
ncbi:MAG: citramalate synthase [Opitutaceae bacterium]|nr:citramalate synthase [Opitutaceae bacterium]